MEKKSVKLNICYNCMRKLDSDAYICPSCGCNNTVRSNPENVLPEGTILFRKYLVGRMIGRGGFGVTYIGYDLDLQLKVAIKEYFPVGVSLRSSRSYDVISDVSTSQDHTAFSKGCEAFLDEARMLASVNSPYIVHVRDFFREHGTAYIVMDYVEGQTLPQAMQENGGRLDALRVIHLMLPLIEQLDELHERNIIHRDIKPDNIMLVQDRRGEHLILLDFGAARSFISGNVSKTYTAVVTPGFAPLEQYSQRSRQGAYTDVYGLCATIYYAITGVIPPTATERSSDDTPIRPFQTYGIAVPETVEAAIMHGLALRSTDRTQTMHELYEELTANTDRNRDTSENNRNTLKEYTPRYTEHRKSSHAQRTGSTRRKKKKATGKKAAISLLILCLAVLAGSGIYLFTKHNSIPQPTSLPTNPEPMVQTASPEQTQSPQPTPEHAISVIPKNIIVGDYISFGSYEQDNDVTNGKEPIEWLVLDVQEGKAKILSRYALNCRSYHSSLSEITWEQCSLREWLNTSFFYEAFSDDEQDKIQFSSVNTDKNPNNGTNSENTTQDKLFLLTADEANQLSAEDRMCKPSSYCVSQGAFENNKNNCIWWLRTSGNNYASSTCVGPYGTVNQYGINVNYKSIAVRPALWVSIESVSMNTKGNDSEIAKETIAEQEAEFAKQTSQVLGKAEIGDYITFGSYEQDNDLTNGKEPIEWLVLDTQNGKALLLSRYGLDCKPFNNTRTATSWSSCSLNSWLNSVFYYSFTSIEQANIQNTNGSGKLFLLSIEEAGRYLLNNAERKCQPTEYAKSQGVYVPNRDWSTRWWLSTSDRKFPKNARIVDTAGSIESQSVPVDFDTIAVRPAIWVDISALN